MDATIVASFAGVLVLLPVLAAGLSLGARLVAPRASRAKRTLVSSSIAALLPMSIPLLGFLFEAEIDDAGDWTLGLLSIIVATLVTWAVLCLPAAWWTALKVERAEGDVPPALPDDTENPQLAAAEG